jgi:hypothetical protein
MGNPTRCCRIGLIWLVLLSPPMPTWSCLHAADAAGARPNILFILTDDQSHRTVGAYPEAYPWVHTPHMDRLAARLSAARLSTRPGISWWNRRNRGSGVVFG